MKMRCSNCGLTAQRSFRRTIPFVQEMWVKHGIYLCRICRRKLAYEYFLKYKK